MEEVLSMEDDIQAEAAREELVSGIDEDTAERLVLLCIENI